MSPSPISVALVGRLSSEPPSRRLDVRLIIGNRHLVLSIGGPRNRQLNAKSSSVMRAGRTKLGCEPQLGAGRMATARVRTAEALGDRSLISSASRSPRMRCQRGIEAAEQWAPD